MRGFRKSALKEELWRQGLLQATLSKDLDIPQQSMSRYACGYNQPPPDRKKLIAEYLRVPKKQLWQ